MSDKQSGLSRRSFMKATAGAAGGLLLPSAFTQPLFAAETKYPPLGNYPASIAKDSVFVGLTVPLTGPYSAVGKEEQLGYELAIEQLNRGDDLIKQMSPLTKKGVLGKRIEYGIADAETNPNAAVQANTRWVRDKKAVMFTGGSSSAVAIACEKLAQREKTIFMACLSGSNDTTGKDCQRYGFRTCWYAYMAAKAQAPILAKALGKDRKVAYLVPDYTYGHTVYNSMVKFTKEQGWETVDEQLHPLGTSDYSSYLINIANSGADTFAVVAYGADAINSIKQAKQFGILDRMTLVVPYMSPFMGETLGADIMQGVYGTLGFWWNYPGNNEIAKGFVDSFAKKYGKKPRYSAHLGYLITAMWADAVERAGTFYPPEVIKTFEKEERRQSTLGEVYYRACDHQMVRPVPVVVGKKPSDMSGPDDYFEVVDVAPGEESMPPCDYFGCKLGPLT